MEGFLDFYSPRPDELTIGESSICSLDFETTGLYPSRDEIVEIGAVRYRGFKEEKSFGGFIRPSQPIPSEATAVHGIDNSMVADAPSIDERLEDLLSFLEDSILIAHNINFDLSFLDAACRKAGLKMPNFLALDTCSFAKAILKGERGYSLQRLAQVYGLDDGQAHRALDDARTAARLFELILIRIPDYESLPMKKILRLSNTRLFRR